MGMLLLGALLSGTALGAPLYTIAQDDKGMFTVDVVLPHTPEQTIDTLAARLEGDIKGR